MAAIDNIYGSLKDAQQIRAFVQNHWQEIYDKTGRDVNNYLYYPDCWDIYNSEYHPDKEHAITNFPESIDACLVQIGNLPECLQRGLEEQYDAEWFEEVKAYKTPFNFKSWNYEPAIKYTFDWSKFKMFSGFKVNHAMQPARYDVWVDAYYKGVECNESSKRYGEMLWFYLNEHFDPIGWYNSSKELKRPYYTCTTAHIDVHSKKALLRWIRKMKFPKGTELTCSLGWVGSDIIIRCK